MYLERDAVWNVTGDSQIKHFGGTKTADTVGGINMQNGNVTIDKFSGFGNAYFTHNAATPADLSGGTLTIKALAETAPAAIVPL